MSTTTDTPAQSSTALTPEQQSELREALAKMKGEGQLADVVDELNCILLHAPALLAENDRLSEERETYRVAWKELLDAIATHHAQRADDRCWLDDAELYKAAGLPPHDNSVGDKTAMLKNCERFLELRCTGGTWQSYAQLEAEIERLRGEVERVTNIAAMKAEVWEQRIRDLEAERDAATKQRDKLAAAIAEAVIKAGICNEGARSANGPELLMFLDDLASINVTVTAVEAARREATERAAKIAEQKRLRWTGDDIAAAIRATTDEGKSE